LKIVYDIPGRQLSKSFDPAADLSDLRLLTASEESDTSAKQRLRQNDDVHNTHLAMVKIQ
jgi:hypothetical protein